MDTSILDRILDHLSADQYDGLIMKTLPVLPPPEEFFLEAPPYASFNAQADAVLRIEFYQGTLDTYCPECGRETVFTANAHMPHVGNVSHGGPAKDMNEILTAGTVRFLRGDAWVREEPRDYAVSSHLFHVQFLCSRQEDHHTDFFCRVKDGAMMKIGQYPSLADFQTSHIRDYRKVLGDQSQEFAKAVGLHAHGVGIGSFVYLRRIFETLIEESHVKAKAAPGWDEAEYAKGRMEDRIYRLKDHLPEYLFAHRGIYSILSKGIHELTEEECLLIFEPLKVGIEVVLDEKIEQEKKAEKIKGVSNAIAAIKGTLKKP